jgi:hypothetical protein
VGADWRQTRWASRWVATVFALPPLKVRSTGSEVLGLRLVVSLSERAADFQGSMVLVKRYQFDLFAVF